MGGGSGNMEVLTITDASLTSTSNLDTYFEQYVDGWNTENILLVRVPFVCYAYRRLLLCASKYSYENQTGFSGLVYNSTAGGTYASITRNDYATNLAVGDKYLIIRDSMQV